MNVRGFFKNVLTTENKDAPADPVSVTEPIEGNTGMSGFFSGTSRFLDTVQSKKNGLISGISNKLSSIKLPGDQGASPTAGKSRKHEDEDSDSSASEYGQEGDKPAYTEEPPAERRLSIESGDSLPEEEANQWRSDIRTLVTYLLTKSPVTPEMQTAFQNHTARHTGRSAFAKELRKQFGDFKEAPMEILEAISPYICQVLDQCNANEDFPPANNLMQLSFTIYHEEKATSMESRSEIRYLYTLLRENSIWQSMRFWNAAFFIALQNERRKQVVPSNLQEEEALELEKQLQENAAYLQLSKFLWRMYALGIPQDVCTDFMRKQANDAELTSDKCLVLQMNLQKLFKQEDATE
ncbi:unnamed protein product [Calicophoron daubneyi]|uniref:SBF1/SBF2 domain-containing protein n=1 Tax=Calicophoron daubneyi TaxID=300641 RepID=A0AAV2TJD1_CALDB